MFTTDRVVIGRILRIILAIVVVVSIIAGLIFVGKYVFRIREVVFVGEGIKAQVDEKMLTSNLLFYPTHTLRKTMLSQYKELKDVIITKRFPSTLVIQPIQRTTFAILLTSKAWYQLDSDGVVVGVGWEQSYPTITVDVENVHTGGLVTDPRVVTSLQLLSQIRTLLPVTSIETIGNGTSLVAKADKTSIFFSQDQDVSELLSTLQTIVTGVRIKGTMPTVIDTRYSKPVIQW